MVKLGMPLYHWELDTGNTANKQKLNKTKMDYFELDTETEHTKWCFMHNEIETHTVKLCKKRKSQKLEQIYTKGCVSIINRDILKLDAETMIKL